MFILPSHGPTQQTTRNTSTPVGSWTGWNTCMVALWRVCFGAGHPLLGIPQPVDLSEMEGFFRRERCSSKFGKLKSWCHMYRRQSVSNLGKATWNFPSSQPGVSLRPGDLALMQWILLVPWGWRLAALETWASKIREIWEVNWNPSAWGKWSHCHRRQCKRGGTIPVCCLRKIVLPITTWNLGAKVECCSWWVHGQSGASLLDHNLYISLPREWSERVTEAGEKCTACCCFKVWIFCGA